MIRVQILRKQFSCLEQRSYAKCTEGLYSYCEAMVVKWFLVSAGAEFHDTSMDARPFIGTAYACPHI